MFRAIYLFFFVVSYYSSAQVQIPPKETLDSLPKSDSTEINPLTFQKRKKEEKKRTITIEDYKIFSSSGDTTYLDTTLTIYKEYKFNVLKRDDFELMPFANVGQQYNKLGIDFNRTFSLPGIGASAKNINYIESDKIKYYHVPTPMTELFFKTVFEQGQFLDALLTLNTSERLNLSIAYNGFRSLGKYQYEQAEANRFRATFNYRNKSNRYWAKGHFASQRVQGEESGGLANEEEQFESGSEEFLDRSRIDLLFTNANSNLEGRRYFYDHQFNLVRPITDSLAMIKTRMSIGHTFQYESKYFQYTQSTAPSGPALFGDSFTSSIQDISRLKTNQNTLYANFDNPDWGKLKGEVNFFGYNYFFNSLLLRDDGVISNKLEGNELVLGGSYANTLGKLTLKGDVKYGLSGDLIGNHVDLRADYEVNPSNSFYAALHSSSQMPNFNFLLYQSDYAAFNWQNDQRFEKQQVSSLTLGAHLKWFGDVSAKYSTLGNYTYFTSEATQEQIDAGTEMAYVKPFQESESVGYLRVKWQNVFKWRKWGLHNTLLYQSVSQDNQVLNLPEYVLRSTLYFSSDVFDKAMFLQTGVTLKYFDSYHMDAFHPVLGEFYVQNNEEFGEYPLIDVFVNAKVRQTRIYFKFEHLSTVMGGVRGYYASPGYPYRDFVLRFGLVWDFFS